MQVKLSASLQTIELNQHIRLISALIECSLFYRCYEHSHAQLKQSSELETGKVSEGKSLKHALRREVMGNGKEAEWLSVVVLLL